MNQIDKLPVIRRAVADDAAAITRIIRAAWAEVNPDVNPEIIPTHTTLVAIDNDEIVGFVDCFTTDSIDDEPRWEVDWLAVDPKVHGQGLGTGLIKAARNAGKASGATVARALVGVENLPSRRAFEKNGFKHPPDILALFTSDIPLKELRSVADTRHSHLIPVTRLYDMVVWIEGEVTDRVVQQARHLIGVRGWHTAGVLVPRSAKKEMKMLEAEGYTYRGDYYRYFYPY